MYFPIIIILVAQLGQGLEVTTCDCTQNSHKGFISFQEEGCRPEEEPKLPQTVDHVVFSYQEEAIQFPGYICSRWYRQSEVEGGVIYGTKTTLFSRQAIETSPEECWKMQEFKTCGEHEMSKQPDGSWERNVEPSSEVAWMGHVVHRQLNCMMEEVTLEKNCEECAVASPFGFLPPGQYHGNASQHQVTLVWKNEWQRDKPCVLHKLNLAANSTFRPLTAGNFRLRNDAIQSDFVIRPRTLDGTGKAKPVKLCDLEKPFYDVLGMQKIVVMIQPPSFTAEELRKAEVILSSDPGIQELRNKVKEASHLQYNRDVINDKENKLVRELQYLQCETRRTHHMNALAVAQYNGWLAARQLRLPRCSKIQTYGEAVQIIQCAENNVTFTATQTSCGLQPIAGNHTIGITGWELVKFQPCYHTTNFINFNGVVHHFRNSDWHPIATDIELAEHKLLTTFVAREENVFNYSLHRNPGFTQGQIDHISVMADVIARIHEAHTSGASSSAHVGEVLAHPQTNYFSGWVAAGRDGITVWVRIWNIIKWVTIVTISSIVGVAIIWLVRKCHLQYKAKIRDEEAGQVLLPLATIPMVQARASKETLENSSTELSPWSPGTVLTPCRDQPARYVVDFIQRFPYQPCSFPNPNK